MDFIFTVFEAFVRNFYKREQQEFKMGPRDIPWSAKALDEGSERFLPRMQSDVSLESGSRKMDFLLPAANPRGNMGSLNGKQKERGSSR